MVVERYFWVFFQHWSTELDSPSPRQRTTVARAQEIKQPLKSDGGENGDDTDTNNDNTGTNDDDTDTNDDDLHVKKKNNNKDYVRERENDDNTSIIRKIYITFLFIYTIVQHHKCNFILFSFPFLGNVFGQQSLCSCHAFGSLCRKLNTV